MTRSLYFPGRDIMIGLSFAYPPTAESPRLRTLAVRLPDKPVVAVAPVSSRKEAFTTRCVFEEGVPIGRTATTTGRVKGSPGRTAAGGPSSKVRLNSRGAAIPYRGLFQEIEEDLEEAGTR